MSQVQASIIKCDKNTDLQEIGVQPGWFVRYSCCLIWFEVLHVYERSVICVARDPKKRTEFAFIGDSYSSINEFSTGKPGRGSHWIAAERSKSYLDKFFPERDKIVAT